MVLRPGVVGVVIKEDRGYRADDVDADPHSFGRPDGHPPIHSILGVPLRLGDTVIGMIGVANKPGGYDSCGRAAACPPSPVRSRWRSIAPDSTSAGAR